MSGYFHSAGGVGSVLGSKNLKAIGVRGTGRLRIAGSTEEWERVVKLHLSPLSASKQHVAPDSPRPWREFATPASAGRPRPAASVGPPRSPSTRGDATPRTSISASGATTARSSGISRSCTTTARSRSGAGRGQRRGAATLFLAFHDAGLCGATPAAFRGVRCACLPRPCARTRPAIAGRFRWAPSSSRGSAARGRRSWRACRP